MAELAEIPELAEFDRHSGQFGIGLAVLLGGGALTLGIAWAKDVAELLAVSALLAVAALIVVGVRWRKKVRLFKKYIVPAVLAEHYPDLTYDPADGLPAERFAALGIFGNFDRYKSEDRISGYIGKTQIDLAEVHTWRKVRTKNGTHYETVFRGTVLIADFNKDFAGRTVVLPDVAERFFGKLVGKFLQKCNILQGKTVRLEDPEFEKLFSVYSDDQVTARYILTPDFMARLTALRRQSRHTLRMVFERGTMALGCAMHGDWLEPDLCQKLTAPATADRVNRDLALALSPVEMLDLNTRIWTKR